MAERKHLINLHTSHKGNPVPQSGDTKLLLGEIAIDHSNVEDARMYIETDSGSTSPESLAEFVPKQYIDNNVSEVDEVTAAAINDLNDRVTAIEVDGAGISDLSDITKMVESGNTGEGAMVYKENPSAVTYYNVVSDEEELIGLSGTTSGTSSNSLTDASLISRITFKNEFVIAKAFNILNDLVNDLSGTTIDVIAVQNETNKDISEVDLITAAALNALDKRVKQLEQEIVSLKAKINE